MPARRRTTQKNDNNGPQEPDRVQMLAVYHVDLMAEVEGLLRSLTRTQAQIERLRSGDANESQRREAIKLLSGNLKTFDSKLDTLRTAILENSGTTSRRLRIGRGATVCRVTVRRTRRSPTLERRLLCASDRCVFLRIPPAGRVPLSLH